MVWTRLSDVMRHSDWSSDSGRTLSIPYLRPLTSVVPTRILSGVTCMSITMSMLMTISVSAQSDDSTAPPKPAGLAALEVSHNSVTVGWEQTDNGEVTGFQVLRRDREVHAQGQFKILADHVAATARRYVDETVEASRRYVYRVRARNGEMLSRWSNYVNVDIPAAPARAVPAAPASLVPAAPTGLVAVPSWDRVDLSWDDPGDSSITGYQMLRGPAADTLAVIGVDAGVDTTYTDQGVAPGTSYVYAVRATNNQGPGARSVTAEVVTPATPTRVTGRQFDLSPGNDAPRSIWSDGTIMWVADGEDAKLYAYRLTDSGVTYESGKDVTLAAANSSPRDTWSDGAIMWVLDGEDAKLYAYRLTDSGVTYESGKDITLNTANTDPHGVAAAGETFYVLDRSDSKVYAYTLTDSGATYESGKDFGLHNDNGSPADMWSDGTTMWVADTFDDKVYAYTLTGSGAIRNSLLDVVQVSSNVAVEGIWSDGTTMWVADNAGGYVLEYSLDVPGSVSVSGSTNVPTVGSVMTAALTDADGGVSGLSWQWSYSSERTVFTDIPGATGVSFTPREADVFYYLRVTASYDDTRGTGHTAESVTECWVKPALGVAGLKGSVQLDCDNLAASGLWSDGETMWVSDFTDDKLYAYRVGAGVTYDPAKDIVLHSDNDYVIDMWSDGTTMWVLDRADHKVYAYMLSGAGAERDSGKDLVLHSDNDRPRSIWSDGTTVWVADDGDDKVYAYTSTGARRDSGKDFGLDSDNRYPRDMWSDGTTMWVSDRVGRKVYAYTLTGSGAIRNSLLDITVANGHTRPGGIWSDGTNMWVADTVGGYVLEYHRNDPGSISVSRNTNVPTVGSVMTAVLTDPGGGVSGLSWQWSYSLDGAVFTDITGATGSSFTPREADVFYYLRVTTSYSDSEQAGRTSESVTECWVRPTLGIAGIEGSIQLDCDNHSASGLWSDGATMWVADFTDDKLYAYRLTSGAGYEAGVTYDPGKDIALDADNGYPIDMWSDGTTIWVLDGSDGKLYAYTLNGAGASYESGKDIALDADNGNPRGIWSDGTTMWVADNAGGYVLEYSLDVPGSVSVSGSTNVPTVGSVMTAALTDPDGGVSGLSWQWSYSSEGAVFADIPGATGVSFTPREADVFYYLRVTASYDDARGTGHTAESVTECWVRPALGVAGIKGSIQLDCDNLAPSGLWSDGETMWVSDFIDDKLYAYRVAAGAGYDAGVTYDPAKDIVLHSDNDYVIDMWSDGTTMWVLDRADNKVYAYMLSGAGAERDSAKDFVLVSNNDRPRSIWSHGTTVWVADDADDKVYAYTLTGSGARRDSGKDFGLDSNNRYPRDMWSDGTTMWVSDRVGRKVYAYTLTDSGATRNSLLDITVANGHTRPVGIWSDGTNMWVADTVGGYVLEYHRNDPGSISVSRITNVPTVGT